MESFEEDEKHLSLLGNYLLSISSKTQKNQAERILHLKKQIESVQSLNQFFSVNLGIYEMFIKEAQYLKNEHEQLKVFINY
jgi:hypothetical protein